MLSCPRCPVVKCVRHVVMSGDDVCYSVVFGTLVGVFVFSVMWSELLITSAISCPLWSSVYECQRVECAFTSPVRTECGMFVMYCARVSCFVVRGCGVSRRYMNAQKSVRTMLISCMMPSTFYICNFIKTVSCFVVRGCGVSRRYIYVCYCDMVSVVNVYLDHLKFCVVCINSRRYVCCCECDVVSNECNEPTSCLVQPIGAHCCEVMYFGCFGFRGKLGFLNCDDVCMCVVNKQFELLEFVSESVYVDL